MDLELKLKQHPDGTNVYHDKLTNDPIAIAKMEGSGRTKAFHLKWHPDFVSMYPEANHIVNMNFGVSDTAKDAGYNVERMYNTVVNVGRKDVLPVTHVGKVTKIPNGSSHEQTFDQFAVHSADGEHVANMFVNHNHTHHINTKHYPISNKTSHIEFVGNAPTSTEWDTATKKSPGNDPIKKIEAIKYWLDNRGKEPAFIGQYQHDNLKVFKHKLTPEVASEKYMAHLKSLPQYKEHNFVRIHPSVFYAMKHHGQNNYTSGLHEIVDTSQPGIVHHTKIVTYNPDHYKSSPLKEVIE